MADVTLNGNRISTAGDLPAPGSRAPDFVLADKELADVSLSDFRGSRILLNVFPSLDTSVCAMSVRRFNAEAASLDNVSILCISADLPFAHARFCETQGIENVVNLSVFRSPEFGRNYGLTIIDGPMRGLLARAVMVIDENGSVVYVQLVPEISQEPDYEDVLNFLNRG